MCIFILVSSIPIDAFAATKTLPLEERAKIRSEWNLKRVNELLLPAMRKAGLDCWIIMSREFNKDFVLEYIEDNRENTPGGHRNAYIFFDDGSKLHKILLGTHLPRGSKLWDTMTSYHSGEGESGPSLKPILRETIEKLDPKKIGVNQSRTVPMCDGLTVEMKKFLVDAIGPKYAKRLVSAEDMIVEFLDTRLPEEMPYIEEAAKISKDIHWGVLDMIEPGKTTIREMRWWIYNYLAKLDITTWYFNGLRVHRQGAEGRLDGEDTVIQPGDIVNNDIGIVYMGFHTDYKGTGYALKPGETQPPEGLQKALANSLRVQDAVFEIAKEGKLGHQVRSESHDLLKQWGIEGSVYSHSVGVGGHGIGAWMNPNWPDRYGARATFPLRVGAVYALESHAVTPVPEWGGQELRINTEEDVVLTETGFKYIVPRQEKIHLIK
jgi:Xaa-Pro aminopeptidase